MVEIKYVEWGLANNYGDCIELHKDLVNYPMLMEQILEHETGHSSEEGFTFFDFKHDIKPSKIDRKQLLFYMFKHPKTFMQFAPVFYHRQRKMIIYDVNLIIMYLSFLVVGGLIYLWFL